jgi:hypothetical protein
VGNSVREILLCRGLLRAINLRHGTDRFTSSTDSTTHKNPPSSAGPEPATVGHVASTLTVRPPTTAVNIRRYAFKGAQPTYIQTSKPSTRVIPPSKSEQRST